MRAQGYESPWGLSAGTERSACKRHRFNALIKWIGCVIQADRLVLGLQGTFEAFVHQAQVGTGSTCAMQLSITLETYYHSLS